MLVVLLLLTFIFLQLALRLIFKFAALTVFNSRQIFFRLTGRLAVRVVILFSELRRHYLFALLHLQKSFVLRLLVNLFRVIG